MLSSITAEAKLSDQEVEKFIRPMVSLVAMEANSPDKRNSSMEKIRLIREHAREILARAQSTGGEWDGNVFDILEWAFWPNIAGWSLVWEQTNLVKDFVKAVLLEIHQSDSKNIPHPANTSLFKEAA